MGNFPETSSEYCQLAESLCDRFWHDQTPEGMFAVVLACAHLPDWHFGRVGNFTAAKKRELAAEFANWETLRQIANGAKHCGKKAEQLHPVDVRQRTDAWNFNDGWDHLFSQHDFYVVEHLGKERSVFTLCREFLLDFRRTYLQPTDGS